MSGQPYYGGPQQQQQGTGSAGDSVASGFTGTMGDGPAFGSPQFNQQVPPQQQQYGGMMPQATPPGQGAMQPGHSNAYGGGQPNANPQPEQSGGYPAGSGSITRFANQVQQQPGSPAPLYPQSSPYDMQSQAANAASGADGAASMGGSAAGMSYSQRAAMMQNQGGYNQQQQQPQQQQPQQQPNQQGMYGSQVSQPQVYASPQKPPQQQQAANSAGMSFAERSAMMRQNPQPQSNVYGGVAAQQQSMYRAQMQQPQYQQQPVTPQRPTGVMATPTGAQQPAQYGGVPQQQGSPQQQQAMANSQMQQRPGMVNPQQQQGMRSPQQQTQQGMVNPQLQQPQGVGKQGMVNPQQQQQQGMGQQYQQQQQQGMGQQYQQQPGMGQQRQQGSVAQPSMGQPQAGAQPGMGGVPQQMQQPQMGMPQQQPPKPNIYVDPPEVVAQQNRLLTEATRKVQEHSYYMKQAMERNDLPTVLDRAACMVGELGEHAHSHHHHQVHPPAPGATGSTTALSPKNYYELHLRALEELPTLEDYLLSVSQGTNTQSPVAPGMPPANMMAPGQAPMPPMQGGDTQQPTFTMKELYDYVQYCPNVLSRLYLQICAASALIRSGEVGARWVLKDMIESVKCVQNPVRGLFLRHYLLQAFRDKLPNEPIPNDQIVPAATSGSEAAPANNATTPSPTVAADVTNLEKGNVKDSYEFILANFIEMNKLWVRIQHLPGDGKSKEIRRRREKDRNELRILVGTNLVRLSALDSVTSPIYGQVILPTVLDHIVICGDPLAQAYLIDCIVQVFPDEYHIETMPILLAVCPKLRDKVNIRTILQNLMDRLANYLADEELLDEKDSNQVKRTMANDSFRMIDECVQKVYNARGPKLKAKEVVRLQTAMLSFTMKCYKGNLEQLTLCLDNCVVALQQARANQALMQEGRGNQLPPNNGPRVLPQLDPVATKELENLLSIPLDELALGVLTLDHYSNLIGFLPWANRRQVALTMLEAVSKAGSSPSSAKEIDELFSVIAPVLRDEQIVMQQGMQPPGDQQMYRQDAALVSKVVHLLDHPDTDVLFEMLTVVRHHVNTGQQQRTESVYKALVFGSLKLAKRILLEETEGDVATQLKDEPKEESKEDTPEVAGAEEGDKPVENGETNAEETKVETVDEDEEDETAEAAEAPAQEEEAPAPTTKTISCRKVFIFLQEAIASLSKYNPEAGIKLYFEAALTADKMALSQVGEKDNFGQITYELISQSFALYEGSSSDSMLQSRCITAMIGTLLACRSLSKEDYESLIMKTAQYAAKMLKKPDQCAMVAQCAHLFYVVGADDEVVYSNPQRGLECLQRALKLADACTGANPANLQLFVDLLDQYLYFFEKKHPSVTGNYITGLVALIKEHSDNLGQFGGVDSSEVGGAKTHFLQIVRYVKKMKEKPEMAGHFADIDVSSINT